jgi:uncharacterized Zn-finger protein
MFPHFARKWFWCGNAGARLVIAASMSNPPETIFTDKRRVSCDGATDIRAGAVLGHPRVWLEIDEKGYVECGYCDRRFVLKGDHGREHNEVGPGDLDEAGASASAQPTRGPTGI